MRVLSNLTSEFDKTNTKPFKERVVNFSVPNIPPQPVRVASNPIVRSAALTEEELTALMADRAAAEAKIEEVRLRKEKAMQQRLQEAEETDGVAETKTDAVPPSYPSPYTLLSPSYPSPTPF